MLFFVLILDNTIGRRDRDGNRVMKKLPPLTRKEKKKKEKEKASSLGVSGTFLIHSQSTKATRRERGIQCHFARPLGPGAPCATLSLTKIIRKPRI